jgi:peptidyl-prolyl cis-trans isomerase C
MIFSRTAFLIVPVACLLAQTPAPKPSESPKPAVVPAPKSGAAPAQPAPGPQPSVKLEAVNPSQAPVLPPDKVVLTIGEEKITYGELQKTIDGLPEQFRTAARGAGRRQFAENLIRIKLLAREARRLKMDQTPAFQAQMAFQAENLLANLLYQNIASTTTVDEAAVKEYYDKHKGEYEQVHARHILIRFKGSPVPVKPDQKDLTEDEALAKAKEIRTKLTAGGDFAALAKSESDDAGSGANGGDLGTFRHGQMVPSFDQAAFSLPVEQISEPVKSQFGYHIIKVEQRNSKSLDDMKGEIEKKLRPELAQKSLDEMRKNTNVVMDPAYFGSGT